MIMLDMMMNQDGMLSPRTSFCRIGFGLSRCVRIP